MLLVSLVAGAAASAAPPRLLPTCARALVAQPRSVVFACADGNFYADGLTWSGWGRARATAHGNAHVNDCTPYCAAGRFHTFPVVVYAYGSQRCRGRNAYLGVGWSFPGRRPSTMPRSGREALRFACR